MQAPTGLLTPQRHHWDCPKEGAYPLRRPVPGAALTGPQPAPSARPTRKAEAAPQSRRWLHWAHVAAIKRDEASGHFLANAMSCHYSYWFPLSQPRLLPGVAAAHGGAREGEEGPCLACSSLPRHSWCRLGTFWCGSEAKVCFGAAHSGPRGRARLSCGPLRAFAASPVPAGGDAGRAQDEGLAGPVGGGCALPGPRALPLSQRLWVSARSRGGALALPLFFI